MARKKKSKSRKVCTGRGKKRVCVRKPRGYAKRVAKDKASASAPNKSAVGCGTNAYSRKEAASLAKRWRAAGRKARTTKAPQLYKVCHN